MRRRALLLPLLALAALAGGALAQSPFVDVSEGHWAGDAVERIADLGIVIGHPDGTYRGDEAFTRYQAALVVSRLLDVIDRNVGAAAAFADDDLAALRDAVARIGDGLDALEARVSALETGASAGPDADRVTELERRVEMLSAEVERLREALAEVPATTGPVGRVGPEGAPGPAGSEGPRGPVGAPGEGPSAATPDVAPDVTSNAASDAAPDAGAGAFPTSDADVEPTGDAGESARGRPAADGAERRRAYLGFAAVSELNGRVPVRLVLGHEELLGPLGLRATIDYGRQGPIDAGAVTLAAHVTYHLGVGRVRGYLGAGGGYQFDAFGGGQAAEGPFAGALLGIEVGLVGPTSAFVEGMADVYANEPAGGSADAVDDRFHPTLAAGIAVRF
jgi:hypothetical protein